MIMAFGIAGDGRTDPKTPALAASIHAWSSSGPPTCIDVVR